MPIIVPLSQALGLESDTYGTLKERWNQRASTSGYIHDLRLGDFMSVSARKPDPKFVGAGVAIGAGVGAGIGVALGNIAVGVAAGVAVGVVIGAMMGRHGGRPT